jgi:hypothetical protein
MNSLYNISDKYLQLMREIEELEGELTPELEEQLKITEQECEDKIKSYHHIIKNNEGDIQLIKDEKERLSKLANTKENLIKRLKNKILDACQLFGYDGKSGNKKIDYDTLKVYTVNKDKIEVDEERFINYAFETLNNEIENDTTSVFEYTISSKLNKIEVQKLLKLGIIEITEVQPNINKTKINNVIEEGIEVPYCKKINNPYINFR